MDWTFWVGLVVIVAIMAVTYWASGCDGVATRWRRDREVADAVAEAERAKGCDDPLGGGGIGGGL